MSSVYEKYMGTVEGHEIPKTVPVQKTKTNWRDWQADAINKIGSDDFFRVNAPTGSGKSRLLSYLGTKQIAKGKSVLILVPQNNIASAWTDRYDFKVGNKSRIWEPENLSNTTLTIKEELMNMIGGGDYICCYPSFVNFVNTLEKDKKLYLLKNIFLIVDEAHHLAQQDDNYNGLGEALHIALPHLGGCSLSTATPFRGDRLPCLSEENQKAYFKKTYHLSMAEFFSSSDCGVERLHYNIYLFGGSYIDAIKKAKKGTKHSIVYLPRDGSYLRLGSKKRDYKEISKIFPNNLNLLNYSGNSQWQNVQKLIDNQNLNVGAVITQTLIQEGFNWNPCDSIIAMGYSTSITQTVQRIGRMLRNYSGKTDVEYSHLLPYTFDNKDEEKARETFNEYLKVITASMIVSEILQPIYLPKTKRDVARKATVQNRKKFDALERVFGDVGEAADFREMVVKYTVSNTDSSTTKQERQDVLKNYIKQELQNKGKSVKHLDDIFLEIYFGMARAQNLLPSGLSLKEIDIWLLSDEKDPFTVFSTSDAKTFDRMSELLGERKKWTIKDLHKVANERGGRCLDTEYKGTNFKYIWECENKHKWEANWDKVNGGTWCPHCSGNKSNLTIDDLNNFAKEKGGRCVSKTYINSNTKYIWVCDKNHKWKSTWNSIKHQKSWCPHCAGNKVDKDIYLQKMQAEARRKGFTLYSKKYINSNTKYVWKCNFGHSWLGLFGNIKKGQGCPICSGHSATIEMLKIFANKKGGKCLDEKYHNGSKYKYTWQCDKNHKWKSTWHNIKSGHWCPYCSGQKGTTIKKLKDFAKNKGGKCLSNKYINSKTKYEWECDKGHCWKAIWASIQYGSWCPYCSGHKGD